MDSQALATLIAAKVAAEAGTIVAAIGFIGVIVGAVIGVCGTLLLYWLQTAPKRKLDKQRSALLLAMLDDSQFPQHWRQLSTLSRVIGATEATTKRLLIEIGARGSEKDDSLWGLRKHHPLDKTEK